MYAAATVGKGSFKLKGRTFKLQQAQAMLEFIALKLGFEYTEKYWSKDKSEINLGYKLQFNKKDRLVRAYMVVDGNRTESYEEILYEQANKNLPDWTYEEAVKLYSNYYATKKRA